MGLWPKGKKCAVIFSFDVDAELIWKFWLPEPPQQDDISQAEYESRAGLPRVLSILKRTGIKSTFFVPGWVAEKYQESTQAILKAGHEIAHHGYMHENNEIMSKEEERAMLKKGIDVLERQTGQRPVGYRMGWSPNTVELLAELGFLYDSSAMNDDLPYALGVKSRDNRSLVELPYGMQCMDTPYLIYSFQSQIRLKPLLTADIVGKQFRDEFDVLYKEGKFCMYTLHPQVIGRPSRAAMLEKTIRYIQKKPGVWLATAREIAEYIRQLD